MIIEPAKRTQSVREYYFSRKLKEIDKLNNSRVAEGKDKVIGFLMGQVMKEMKGKANPSQVSEMIHKPRNRGS